MSQNIGALVNPCRPGWVGGREGGMTSVSGPLLLTPSAKGCKQARGGEGDLGDLSYHQARLSPKQLSFYGALEEGHMQFFGVPSH